jgi:hypothetical protein
MIAIKCGLLGLGDDLHRYIQNSNGPAPVGCPRRESQMEFRRRIHSITNQFIPLAWTVTGRSIE